MNYTYIASQALTYWPRVVNALGLKGRLDKGNYLALNPTRNDKTIGSFVLDTKRGRWCDFATGDKGGDLISYVAYCRGIKQSEAAQYITHLLGANNECV